MTNGPPLLGKVLVNPTTGFEILDKFYFTASKWEDDDLPLSYSYGFYRSDGSKNVLQTKSEANNGEFIFPSGGTEDSFVTYYFEVFDSFNLNSTRTGNIEIISIDDISVRRNLISINNTNANTPSNF